MLCYQYNAIVLIVVILPVCNFDEKKDEWNMHNIFWYSVIEGNSRYIMFETSQPSMNEMRELHRIVTLIYFYYKSVYECISH